MLNQSQALDLAFQALADPTRRQIVERLTREPISVSELARPLKMSLPAVMQHLAVLEASGLVRSQKSGRVRTCRINPEALSLAERWINDRRIEWERRLDRLRGLSRNPQNRRSRRWPRQLNEPCPSSPPPVRISRTLHAPRELVFKAWSAAEHVKRWFAPTGFTVPQANVRMHVGGPFEVLMRAPDGVEHWARGKFVEVSEFDRLALDLIVEDVKGHALFRAYTEADFRRRARRHADRRHADLYRARSGRGLDGGGRAARVGADARQSFGGGSAHADRPVTPVAPSSTRPSRWSAPMTRRSSACFTRCRTRRPRPNGSAARTASGGRSSAAWIFASAGASACRGRWESGVVSTFDAVYHDIVAQRADRLHL